MAKMVKGIVAAVLTCALMLGILAACSSVTPKNSNAEGHPNDDAGNSMTAESEGESNVDGIRTITDLAGRTVEIPDNPMRIATIDGPSFEKIVMLGGSERIAMTRKLDFSKQFLMTKMFPGAESVPTVEDHFNPNIEELLEENIDLVFFRDSVPDAIAKMEEAGIPVVITQISQLPSTDEEFYDLQKKEVMVIGEVLGGESIRKAQEWCDYFDEQIQAVSLRTVDVADRPSVYYIKGPSALSVFDTGSYLSFWISLAGGNFVSIDTGSEATMEQVVSWNPEYIFLGRTGDKSLVLDDTAWSDIQAVRKGNVSVYPKNVQWDYSCQGILQLSIMAKTIHPNLFEDVSIETLIKDYYREFYNYELSDDELAEVYAGE